MAWAELYRAFGVFANALRRIDTTGVGKFGCAESEVSMSALRTLANVAMSFVPINKRWWVMHSNKTIPKENKSLRKSVVCEATCSGDMYPNFPCN